MRRRGTVHGDVQRLAPARAVDRDDEEGLTLEEASAWARERAERVILRLGDGDYVSADAWVGPPPVRRWPAGQEWKARTDADPPIDWVVTATVTAPHGISRVDADALVAPLAATAADWDAELFDEWDADHERARRRARGRENYGWFS
jgi:hypothetical protein